ncbi:uncharacterized protein A1O9_06449, partial [Exophiala aquamarina CBS 119918]
MFARVTTSAHVCLRCQRRLANIIPAKSSQLNVPSTSRRWQSSAVARLEEEEEEHLNAPSTPALTQTPPKFKSFTRWRPPTSKSAELGVNSLGKPAEVLILPAHDRKIPTLATEAGGQEDSVATLQESLDSEQSHVDPASLHRAIGQVYDKFLESRDDIAPEITLEEYNSMHHQMLRAFTQAQLQHYLLARLPDNHPFKVKSERSMKRSMKSRSILISKIFTEVWGLVIPSNAINENKSYNYIPDEATFEYLLTDPRQPLSTIAKEKNVTINAFRRERRFEVSGTPHAAKSAKKAINNFHKNKDNLQSIVVNFMSKKQSIYADPSMRGAVKAFLRRVQEKYHLHIAIGKTTIKIVHHNMPHAAKQAADEIRIAGESKKEIRRVHICQPRKSSQMALERYPTPPEFPLGISQTPWSRLMTTNIETSMSDPSSMRPHSISEAATIVQKLSAFFEPSKFLSAPTTRSNVRSEVTAIIGQALFQSKPIPLAAERAVKRPLANTDSQSTELSVYPSNTSPSVEGKGEHKRVADQLKSMAGPTFAGDLPFTLQQLINLDSWKELPLHTQRDIVTDRGQSIHRLVFACANIEESNNWPSFEVYASSALAAHTAERAELTVLRISAIHAQRSFYALFPEGQNDVKFTQQIKHDLVYPNKNKLVAHASTLEAFSEYFKSAQLVDGTRWIFESPLNLPVAFTMRSFAERRRLAPWGRAEISEAGNTTYDKALSKVGYYLHSMETVEADSHSVPVPITPGGSETATLSLDNITFSGSNVTRQELRLSDRPLFSTPSLKKLDLTTLVNGAMALAEHLGKDP